ncbi:MAG TPA: hypothetical protein VJ831_05845, partial [Jatrophihabitantaceae bacterium]|nr:hypothetical protein [Jatrophihabitantaceae bacterium]
IAVDGHTKLPLGVQVFARGNSTPAIDIAFSDVSFRTPDAGYFSFTPPPGATVKQGMTDTKGRPATPGRMPKVHGTGWTTVIEYDATRQQIASIAGGALRSLEAVRGTWGSGRLLESALVSVLITSDNRVFVGAVDPATLYRTAAATK